MEKDDKIQRRQEKANKYGWMAVVTIMVAGGIFMMTNSDSMQKELQNAPHQVAKFVPPKERMMVQEGPSIAELQAQYNKLDEQVRDLKARVKIMETDPECLRVTGQLQDVARKLIVAKYGKPPYRVKVDLEFPPTIPDFATGGKDGSITIEMAPIEYIPVSVWTFLEVSRTFVKGAFHRNAGHVLQVAVTSTDIKKHLPFQEYSKEFPHKKGTTGYCGRPSGPCWYVSIQDNTFNHVSEWCRENGDLWCCILILLIITLFDHIRDLAVSNKQTHTKQMPILVQ